MGIPIKPMLAKKYGHDFTAQPISNPSFVYEHKYDGMRVIVRRYKSRIRLWTRKGMEVTEKFPELLVPEAFKGPGVWDGEIVYFDKQGRQDFHTVVGRRHLKDPYDIEKRSKSTPCICVLFDCLKLDDLQVTGESWTDRRDYLELETLTSVKSPYQISHVFENGVKLFAKAKRKELEGIMAKDQYAPYYPGKRRTVWLKIKVLYTVDVLVTGYVPGKGKRTGYVGSLILTDLKGKSLGFVGTGHEGSFDMLHLEMMNDFFDEIGVTSGLKGTKILMKPIPAEVICLRQNANALREPRFHRFRRDLMKEK